MGFRPSSEESFMRAVMEAARLNGFAIYHTLNSLGSEEGFPDLVLVKGGRLIFAELKGKGGKYSAAQNRWLQLLAATPAEVYRWTAADWDEIESVLRGKVIE
jgi:hypothetical protein